MSYSVAAFPTLSSLYAKHDQKGFNLQLMTALRHIIFWSIPVIGLVIVLRAQIVRVLLGSGEFDWSDTRLTAAVLAIFVTSLFAQAILLLLIRAFYAGGRTLLPLAVAGAGALVSLVSAAVLYRIYNHSQEFALWLNDLFRLTDVSGSEVLVLALGFIVGQFCQLVVLLLLSRNYFKVSYRPLARLSFHAVLASITGAILAYATLAFVVDGVNQNTLIGILLQGLVAGVVGLIGIILVYVALGSKEILEVYKSFQAKLFKTDVVAPHEEG
jgi:putative peptidoglycan lipid II flippase